MIGDGDGLCGKGYPATPVCASSALFANKFDVDVDALAPECVSLLTPAEEKRFERPWDSYYSSAALFLALLFALTRYCLRRSALLYVFFGALVLRVLINVRVGLYSVPAISKPPRPRW